MTKAQPHKLMMEWNEIDWRKAEVKTFKLQHRIFRASERGDVKAVRKLQKTLIRSWSARLMAARESHSGQPRECDSRSGRH